MKVLLCLAAVICVISCDFDVCDDNPLCDILYRFTNKRGVEKRNNNFVVKMIFLLADSDGNGLLDIDELTRYTKPQDGTSPRDKAAQTVQLGDRNNDNMLSREEMLLLLDFVNPK